MKAIQLINSEKNVTITLVASLQMIILSPVIITHLLLLHGTNPPTFIDYPQSHPTLFYYIVLSAKLYRFFCIESNQKNRSNLKAANRSPLIPDGGLKFITIGKESIAIPIASIASINDPPYQKATCFQTLFSANYGLLYTSTTSTAIIFVTQQ